MKIETEIFLQSQNGAPPKSVPMTINLGDDISVIGANKYIRGDVLRNEEGQPQTDENGQYIITEEELGTSLYLSNGFHWPVKIPYEEAVEKFLSEG